MSLLSVESVDARPARCIVVGIPLHDIDHYFTAILMEVVALDSTEMPMTAA